MYLKSAILCERLSAWLYWLNCSLLEPTTVNMLVCLRCWLSNDIWARKRLCYSMFLTKF